MFQNRFSTHGRQPWHRLLVTPAWSTASCSITGGSTGIGATLVEQFVEQGARVGFIDIDVPNAEALVEAADAGAPGRHRCSCEPTSATWPNSKPRSTSCANAWGRSPCCSTTRPTTERHKIEATTSESWDAGIAVNLKHQFFAAKKVSGDMKAAGGGSIVNFGSVSWKLKQGGMPVYTTAKSAVQGLTRSLARDFGPFNIRVNTIVPGWVMTEKQKTLWLDEAGKADMARGQCINRDLMPIHIASMTLFLAADDSAMCTAQDFIVDGGWV